MAGRKNAPSSLQIHQNISDSEDGPNSEPTSGNRPNGRVYSPDYISPPCYQPPNPLSTQHQSQYQQPYTTRSTPLLVDHQKNHEITDDRSENQEHMEPPYYLQDQIKNRSLSESKQLPEEYRGMPIGGDPPPYRQPPKAIPVRDNRYRSEYNSDPPGHLALPPTDYRQQYFTQGLNGGNEVNRRFSPLRLPIVGTQWRVCSWRLCALAFLTLSLGLAATTIYLAAFQVADWNNDAHCLPGSSDVRMAHSPSSHSSHRLPNQQRPADSGKKHNSGGFLAPLLFPSMILLQDTLKEKFVLAELNVDSQHDPRESIYSRRTSAKFGNEVTVIMHDRYAYQYVTPPLYSSVTKKPVKLLLYPSRVAYHSKNNNNNRYVNQISSHSSVDVTTTAAVFATTVSHYLPTNVRQKRSISEETTLISTVELASRETTSLITKDQIINTEEEGKNAILQNHQNNNETSKLGDISETANFMKNLMSQPALNLRSVSKNVEKNLHMSKDEENAFLSTEDINLYANDIVNLETQNKNSSSLLPQTMNKSKNIDESSSSSAKTFVTFQDKSLSILKSMEEMEGKSEEEIWEDKMFDNVDAKNISTDFETDSNADNETAFSNKFPNQLSAAVYVTSSQEMFDNDSIHNPTDNVIETLPPSFDRDVIIDLKARPKDESILKKEFVEEIENTNESASVVPKTNHSDSRENFYSKEMPDVPRSSAEENISAERDDAARFIISSKLNTSSEPKRMSKLNHAFSDGHFQEEEKEAERQEEDLLLSLVNSPEGGEEERRQLQKESYNLKVDSEGRQVSNQISTDDVLDSNRKFKEAVSAHKMRALNPSPPEEEGLNPINLKSNRSQTNLTQEDYLSVDFVPSYTVANEGDEEIERSEEKAHQTTIHSDTYNRSLYSEFNGEMTSSVSQNGGTDKESDPIMIEEFDPGDVTQNSKLEKLENGTEKTKQNHEQNQQQQPAKNQYPPFGANGEIGDAPPLAKAPKIPEEDLKNTEEMFDEYSNSAPRISSKADIESIAFFNASTIYLRSTPPRLIDSESFGDPDHEALSTIRGFMDNTREMEPFYQTKSTAEENENLMVEKTFLQSSQQQRYATDDDTIDVYHSVTKFLNLKEGVSTPSIIITPSTTLRFTLSVSPSPETIFTKYLEVEIPLVKSNSKILGPNSFNLNEDRIEQTNEYKFTSDNNRISSLEMEAFTTVLPFASFVVTTDTISHTITDTILPSTSQSVFAKPINTILHSTLANNESNNETVSLSREEDADLVQRERDSSLFVNGSLGSPIPPIDITDGFVERPFIKATKLVIQSASSLPYDGVHNHEKYSHSGSNSFVKDEIADLIYNHTPTNHIYNTTSRAENFHKAPANNKNLETPINGGKEGAKLFNNVEISRFREKNEENENVNKLITTENNEFKNEFSKIQSNVILTTSTGIYGNHLAIMFSDKNLAPNNINDIKYWNKSSTTPHADSSIEKEKFAAAAIDVDNSTETLENSKQVFDGIDNVGKQSLDQVWKEDAEVFPGSNSGNQELNVNTGLKMENEINEGIDEAMGKDEIKLMNTETREGIMSTEDVSEGIAKNYDDEFTDYHSLDEIEEIMEESNEEATEEINVSGRTGGKEINIGIEKKEEEIEKTEERKFILGNLSPAEEVDVEENAKKKLIIDPLKEGITLRGTNNNDKNSNKTQDFNTVSDGQLAFDQHSGNELETLSWDRNKEPLTVTSGMKTTSRGGTQDDLPESYVPIFQLEKHHLLLPNIYSDQNQQRNESFQRVIGSGNKHLFESSSSLPSTESPEDSLRRAKDTEVTSLQKNLEIQQIGYSNLGMKEAVTEESLESSFNDTNSLAYDRLYLSQEEHFPKEVDDQQHLIREKNENHLFTERILCPCSCPCNESPLRKQSNSSASQDEITDANTNTADGNEGPKEVTPRIHKENDWGESDNDNDDEENREFNFENGEENGELEKHISNGNKNSNNVSKAHRHRHHHGEKHLMRKQSHSNEQLPPVSPSSINMKKQENFPTEMANLSSCNSSLRRQIEERNGTGDIDNLAGSSSRKRTSPPDLEKCSRGSKECSADRIASLYLNLFGSKGEKRTPSSHFYVVPILYGEEINSQSWHWKTLQNASNELSSADLEESLNSTGSSTVRRPHQIAPPDGASFSALILGEALTFLMPPYGYWNLHLTLSDATEMHLALTIPRGTSIGLYARRNSLPTHTQHDLMKVLRGSSPRESRSTSGGIVEVTLEEVLESGDWFLSFYNDDGDPHKVGLLATRGSGSGECPQRCNGRGHCFLGRCQCQTGYSGHDCSEVLCPILCNGRGEYVEGQCQCHPGWKGKECELKHHECEVPDCSGHGHCVEGVCHCATGFTGEFCEKVDCPNPTCSGHGWCVRGTCVCDRGWKRPDCSQMDTEALQCLPDCNKHGTFDINTHSCICNPPWTGSDCSKEACSLDCGPHGKCENEVCQCDEGWTGPRCTERLCDSRCAEHGQCKNGTCVCMTGWNGRHCTLAGCPLNCMGPSNGRCVADNEGQWSCKCNEEWEGIDCAVQIELVCSDGIDNDKDGLDDCNDPECCEYPACSKMPQCTSLPSPIDILLKMQPPAATASFYEKMQFIVQDNSLQSFQRGSFNKRRAAVIRGRVVTAAGRPIVGLRISSLNDSDGITFTRLDGMFDFMINGGGAVTVRFGKQPLSPREIQVVVPWNEIVVLDDVVMIVDRSDSHHSGYRGHGGEFMDKFGMFNDSSAPCPQHDYDLLRPIIMSTWQNEFQGECPAVDAILVETQAVQESVQIPGTGLFLVYHSSRATGYKSTLRFQLTPERIPTSLRRVHLRIVLEGILFKKVFEADPLLKFTYSWDRNNVYKLSVYGTTIARISVGYEHSGCENMIIWDHHTTKVAGYDLAISEMGGFNLHVHHAYNFHQGILQKGDGRNIHLAGQRHLVTTLLGTGEQREVVCGSKCDGEANKNPLLAPTCLAAAPDGSLYVGDFNLIRRVTPEGKVFTVARLNETRVSYRYHVAVSPVTGDVYVSDPDAHQVLKLQKTFDVQDPSRNVIPIVGSGQRCLPGDRNKCGDGGPAIHARLTYPKGLAISAKDEIYIADGTNIRVVSGDVIRTVIGGHDHRSHWAPVPCNGTIERDQLRLRWPTELAISPLDGSLHILDDHLVLRLTPDNRVQVLTGRPLHCPAPSHNPQHMSRAALLLAPQSIAFSLQGDLYIAESDTQRINRVRVITTDGHISTFAGADSKCNCRDRSCFCHTFDNVSATSAVFSLISAIAVTPDGILHISDQAGYRIRSVRSLLPEQNEQGEYEIFSPDTHEVFVFNRFGKHMETRNLVTGQTIYKFTYNTNANTGKLSSVTDAAGNSFKVIRRTYAKKTFIENPQKQRVTIHFTIMNNDLEKLEAPDGYNITFRYHSASGLIQSKMEGGGRTYSYEYDDQGRLVRAVLPTGEVIALNFDLSIRGAQVTATRDGENSVTAIIRGNTITHKTDSVQAISEGSGVLRLITAWDHEISMERTSYRVLETKSPTSAQMFPILSKQQTHIGKDLVNTYEWSFSPAEHVYKHDGMKVSADLRVNTVELLSLEYDPVSSSEALRSDTGEILVNITYDKIGRPTRWLPKDPLVPTSVNYDAWGHVTLWKRGRLSEEYEYDPYLRLASVTYGDNTTIRYEFKEQLTKPERVTYPSGRSYGLVYDEAGAIQEVVTPKGSTYSLHLSTSLGFYRLRLALPGNTVIMQMRVDEQGRLVTVSHPDEEGILLYEYDLLGRLRNELYGHGFTEYTYLDSGLLKTARTRHTNHDIRIEYRYRTGLAKEMKIKYGSKSNLHDAKFHYQYDESARLRVIEGEIESNAIPEIYLKYDNLTGSLLAVNDLRVIRNNILETTIHNQKKYFVYTRKLDNYGRISEEVIRLQDRTVYLMELKYDLRGRISEQLNEISGRRMFTNYKYMADGQILEATGGHTRLYTYDKNGNVLSFTDENRAEFLHYDESDRVIKAGDGDVEYNSKGYVIRFDKQNFEYNTKGQLVTGYSRDKSWSFTFRYDHLNRVSVYRDHLGNVTQIIYGRPDKPNLISHLHNPQTHSTYTLIYDDRNRLIAMNGPEGQSYIATDQNGAPIAFFDENGGLIRRQRWTPFGRVTDYAGTPMWVGIGPWGGLLEPITGIIVLDGYAYHPRLLQWMIPRWDKLTRATRQVTDVFVYRFRNNDPINPPGQLDYHFNDVSDWLRVMGYELNKVLGSEYQGYMLERPLPTIDVSALANSEVVSGLWCQYRASINHLQDLSFFSRSHIQRRVGEWTGAPISRQSYVFGPGVLVSNVDGFALVTSVPLVKDGSTVIGNVIRAVLNNSLILDVSSTHEGRDTFYFIKEEQKRANEDRETLARLSGIYNVTHMDSNGNLENHVATPTANIVIFYNKKIDKIRNRILAQLEVRGEEAAWAREAALVKSGRPGTRAWDPTEVEELTTRGRVSSYLAKHVHPSNKYPLLAADPSNILFKHESTRKRRKSRRKERKKGWRRRNKFLMSGLDT